MWNEQQIIDSKGNIIPICSACSSPCWKFEGRDYNPDEPCWGEIGVSEDYPSFYVHFCEGHGHPDDGEPYKHKPTNE